MKKYRVTFKNTYARQDAVYVDEFECESVHINDYCLWFEDRDGDIGRAYNRDTWAKVEELA